MLEHSKKVRDIENNISIQSDWGYANELNGAIYLCCDIDLLENQQGLKF